MASVIAQPTYIFGLRTGVTNNLCFSDEQTVVFPCGNNCVCYNIDQKCQRLIPGTEKSQGMQALAISANRHYLAVSERGEKATITVYELQPEQGRKREVLSTGDTNIQEFVCMAFSPDSKYLIGQAGSPEWMLIFWLWEKQEVMATVKTSSSNNPVTQVSFNPYDNTQICVSGSGVLKLFGYSEGALKQSKCPEVESVNFLCHAWMTEEQVIAGTDTGRLLVFESGELRGEISSDTKSVQRESDRQIERSRIEVTNMEENPVVPRITAILSYSKGFACSTIPGTVCLYEKTEEDSYRKTRELRIPPDPCCDGLSQAQQQEITTMCVSPSEETLAISTDQGQLYSINLPSVEMRRRMQAYFKFLSHSFHSKAITGLSTCVYKPFIATSSLDRSVRIWNYQTKALELYKEFWEEVYSVALHPTGLFILLGFADKLRLMNLLIDDIRILKEFAVRDCRKCAFSHGGHLFAAASGNIIHIYSFATLDIVLSLKGHRRKVQAIKWSLDDSRLVSCSLGGVVYEWNTGTGRRESESILRSCCYTDVAFSSDGSTVFAVGTDCTLKEIQDCQILREVPADDVAHTAITMSRSGKVVFTGTCSGTIRAIKYPLPIQRHWIEYQAHCGPVTKMVITFDDQFLVTVSKDGCLLVWNIIDQEERGQKSDKQFIHTKEMLTTKSDLDEKNQNIMELKMELEELKTDMAYQCHRVDWNYNEKIKELSEKFIRKFESLETMNQIMKTERREIVHQEIYAEATEKHSKELQDLELSNNEKLMLKSEKYQELQYECQTMQEDYEKQLTAAEESKHRAMEELTQFYETQLQGKTGLLGQCQDEARKQTCEYEEIIKQTEQDVDHVVQDIQTKYKRELQTKKETNLNLKGETGIMKKKLNSLQRELDDRCSDVNKLKQEQQKLHGLIRPLENNIQGLKKQILRLEKTSEDKDKSVGDMEKKNLGLRKLTCTLDYKITELKNRTEPQGNGIKEREQIQEIEKKLEQVHKRNIQLEQTVSDWKLKLKTANEKMCTKMQELTDMEAYVNHFKSDLCKCLGFIQEPKKFKDSIQEFCTCYIQPNDVVEKVDEDPETQREHSRHIEHLKKTEASLNRKLAKASEDHRNDRIKVLKENVSLIGEISELRQELRTARSKTHNYKIQMSLNKKSKKQSSADVRAMPKESEGNPVVFLNFKEEAERIIHFQRSEIQRLKQEIHCGTSASATNQPPQDS